MVVDEGSTVPLLGSRTVQAMNLVKVQYENIMAVDSIVTEEREKVEMWSMDNIKKDYADVFQGDGCLEGAYKIEADPKVTPVKLQKRRVPVAMMAPLKTELSDLQQRRIITPVDCSTEWISSLVIVRKPSGNLRICIDPRPLNRALKRCHFPSPTIDDILPDLSRAKVFSVCDIKNGFWHVTLDEESSYMTTFATPYGRYRWLRMPMGISPVPEVFQRKLNQALEGSQGIYVIADNILITGEGATLEKANQDHDDKLRAVLNRCREKNIKLNAEKFQLRRSEVPYIGHLLTAEGLSVNPEKARAVRDMPRPTDVKGVQRFLGMINYLSKFCDHLSDGCEILRQLTHKDTIWEWSDAHERVFTRLKDAITKAPILKYYNPDEPYLPEHASEGSVEKEIESINMVQQVHTAEERMQSIREETSKDRKLQTLIKVIQEGWPMNKKDMPSDIAHYHSFQEELSAQSGIVFRGESCNPRHTQK